MSSIASHIANSFAMHKVAKTLLLKFARLRCSYIKNRASDRNFTQSVLFCSSLRPCTMLNIWSRHSFFFSLSVYWKSLVFIDTDA